jgi:hypothetical protein
VIPPAAGTPAGRVLLDECVPRRFRRELTALDVSHAIDEGWAGKRNGALIQLMIPAGFTTLVTVDRNLQFQQNIAASGVAVIVLHAPSNRLPDLRPLVPDLERAFAKARLGEIQHVGV